MSMVRTGSDALLERPARWAQWLSEGKAGPFDAAIASIAAYCLLQVLMMTALKLWSGTGVGIDDAEQLVYLPNIWAGYGGSQPPLYSWMNWAAATVLGVNVFTLRLVKYLTLLMAAVCVGAGIRRLGYGKPTAAAAMFGLFTIPQIVWESQRALSHSVAAIGFCALAFLALADLLKRRTARSYLLFGLAAGLAVLAKYNDVVLVASLVAAALSLGEYRSALLNPKFAISLAAAALVVAPTVLWNIAHPDELLARSDKFGIAPGEHFHLAFTGVGELFWAALNFAALPLFIVALALLAARPFPSARVPAAAADRLLGRILIFGLAFVAVLVVATGITEIRDRWLLPVLFLLPIAAAARLDAFGEYGRQALRFMVGAGAAIALFLMPGLWYIQVAGGNGQDSIVRLDYPALYRELTADGTLTTVVSDWNWIGNLRLVAGDGLTLLSPEVPDFARLMREPAVLIWLDHERPSSEILKRITDAGYAATGAPRQITVPEVHISGGDGRLATVVKLKRKDGAMPD